jgi:AcrR family transcriptional regulator
MNKPEFTKGEQTQERIIQAATEEFAAHGIAGGRIDRIAAAARANKALIYNYFGNKEQLFRAVLERHLADIYSTVRFSPDDLPGYAAALFDFAMDHPHVMRLVMWNGLAQSGDWPLDESSSLSAQVASIRGAQAEGRVANRYPADFLLTLVVTLASAWTAANPFGMSIAPDAVAQRSLLRTAISMAVSQLSQAD